MAQYLDLTGLTYFWGKVKTYLSTNYAAKSHTHTSADITDLASKLASKVNTSTTVNGKALSGNITLAGGDITVGGSGAYSTSDVADAINSLDEAVKDAASKAGVTTFGGKTGAITLKAASATPGSINLSMTGNELTATIEGWNTKSDNGHTHQLANITDLNDGWDALLKAAPDLATADQGDKADTAVQAVNASGAGNLTLSASKSGTTVTISGSLKTSLVSDGSKATGLATAGDVNTYIEEVTAIKSVDTTADSGAGTAEKVVFNIDGTKKLSGSVKVQWENIGSKPSTFTPSTHTHTSSQITDFNNAVNDLINDKMAANDAMIFKGTLGTGGTVTALPTTGYSAGWTYKVITAGSYAGQTCEVGDMIIAVKDYATATANSDWTVVQTNIDGAVTGPASATSDYIAVFNGTTGKVIKQGTKTISAIESEISAVSTKADSLESAIGDITSGVGNVISFGGKTGAIIIDETAASATTGSVQFAMSNNKLTGKVAYPSITALSTSDIDDLFIE